MDIKDQITAALKKLGPISPGRLAEELGKEPSQLSYHAKTMLIAGTIKAAGVTAGRRLALPDQEFVEEEEAAPQRGKKASKKRGKKAERKARAPKAPEPAATPARDFLVAITADSRIVLITDGASQLLSEEDSAKVAQLCLAHFDEE